VTDLVHMMMVLIAVGDNGELPPTRLGVALDYPNA